MSVGPLEGLRVVEFAGIGPVPFCGMLFADLGADVIRIDRASGGRAAHAVPVLNRGRRSLALDLRRPEAVEIALQLLARSDGLLEGYRPGVMERFGLSPDRVLECQPALVYGRLTGWGRDGPLAGEAGHDINYIGLSGALQATGEATGRPMPAINLVGDFGGGALLLAVGVLAALLEARRSGQGQVVDAAMTDGTALLMTLVHELRALGQWQNQRESNAFDGGAPFYGTYRCSDGRYVALGVYEPEFYAALLAGAGLDPASFGAQWDRSGWPALRASLTRIFAARSRDEWCAHFAGRDACVSPVLDLDEAPDHPHNVARGTYVQTGNGPLPAAAPRFSRTPAFASARRCVPGDSTEALLAELGYDAGQIDALRGGAIP